MCVQISFRTNSGILLRKMSICIVCLSEREATRNIPESSSRDVDKESTMCPERRLRTARPSCIRNQGVNTYFWDFDL